MTSQELEERTQQVMMTLVVARHPQNADWVLISGPGEAASFSAAYDGRSPKAPLLLDLSKRVVALAMIQAGAV